MDDDADNDGAPAPFFFVQGMYSVVELYTAVQQYYCACVIFCTAAERACLVFCVLWSPVGRPSFFVQKVPKMKSIN